MRVARRDAYEGMSRSTPLGGGPPMLQSRFRVIAVTAIAVTALIVGCAPEARPPNTNGEPPCEGGERCGDGNAYQRCVDGAWVTEDQCTAFCDAALGCVACQPNMYVCDGGDVHSCGIDGVIGPMVVDCDEGCSGGE